MPTNPESSTHELERGITQRKECNGRPSTSLDEVFLEYKETKQSLLETDKKILELLSNQNNLIWTQNELCKTQNAILKTLLDKME